MNEPDVRHADATTLAHLMGLEANGRSTWSDRELAEILRHQWTAPLLFDLGGLPPGGEQGLNDLIRAGTGPIASFGELLRHPTPPIELLLLVKQFGKTNRAGGEALPPQIATLLYYASIAVALLRHNKRITGMDDQSLRSGLEWAINQPWVDEPTRGLLREGLLHITQSPPQAGP